MKVLIFVCSLALAQAGIIGTNYSPATSVSTVYSSINNPVYTKTITPVVAKTFTPIAYTKTFSTPAPVYESVLSTHESRTKSLDGTQYNTFAKSLNTPYASVNKFESHSTNDGILGHSTVYSSPTIHPSQILSQPAYSISTPYVHSVSSPVTYTTHAQAPIVTKTISSPAIASYSSPVLTKTVTAGLGTYASHTPVVQAHPAVKITYSEAPLVSHMTFTGLGTSYSW